MPAKLRDSGNNPCKYFDSEYNYCNWVRVHNGFPEGPLPEDVARIVTCYCSHPSECSQYEDYIRMDHQEAESKSGCCYIATACYGSYDCPQVITFRNFRDYYLAQTILGRAFIKMYYALSPPVARWLKNKYRMNSFIRVHILDAIYGRLRKRY